MIAVPSMLLRLTTPTVLLFFALVHGAAAQLAPARDDTTYALRLSAKLTSNASPIEKGMVWRIFSDKAAETGINLVKSAEGGTVRIPLPAGTYLVYAGYGRAGLTKRVELARDGQAEDFVLNAGGLRLNAATVGGPIRPRDLRFSIYELEQDAEGRRKLIAMNVEPNRVVRLNEGTYHVVSRFGTINASVRADLQVKPGKITAAELQHRGAEVSIRLVSRTGGDPIANTSWTVFTADGEKVFMSKNIAPSLILAEGVYEAAAQNGNRTFRSTFTVKPGQNIRVEVRRTN
ncbi:MAG: hypothetical protein AAFO73_10530 [Pseudomonadota bacterium]